MTTKIIRSHGVAIVALAVLVIAMGGTWHAASAAPNPLAPAVARAPAPSDEPERPVKKSNHKDLTGKLNLNSVVIVRGRKPAAVLRARRAKAGDALACGD